MRGPDKTAGSVGIFERRAASFYLDFLFLFHQGKRKKKKTLGLGTKSNGTDITPGVWTLEL